MNEAEVLFSGILDCNGQDLYLRKQEIFPKEKSALAAAVLKRRIGGEPLAYIMGKAFFFGLEFKASEDVLVPRPETEILVETALRFASSIKRQVSGTHILELGTGSGCVAVCLAKELPFAKIDAVDISEKALEVAKENARLHGVKINFVRGDLFGEFTPHPECPTCKGGDEWAFGRDSAPRRNTENKGATAVKPWGSTGSRMYDFIVSNPPYIRSEEIDVLQPEVRREPRIALDGGPCGLDFYHRIIADSPAYLKETGCLIMEMGYGQCGEIKDIFARSGKFELVEVVKDYCGIDRVIVSRRG